MDTALETGHNLNDRRCPAVMGLFLPLADGLAGTASPQPHFSAGLWLFYLVLVPAALVGSGPKASWLDLSKQVVTFLETRRLWNVLRHVVN